MIDIQNVTILFYQRQGKVYVEVRCPKCQSKPDIAEGAQNKDDLKFMLICPKCATTLIEYSSPEELSTELSKIVERWRVA